MLIFYWRFRQLIPIMAFTIHVVNHSRKRYREAWGNVGPDTCIRKKAGKAEKVYNRSRAKATTARFFLIKKYPFWLRTKAKNIAR